MSKWNKYVGVLGICFVVTLFVQGCSSDKVNITIDDAYIKSEFEDKSGRTVAEILEDAEVDISKEDITTPALDQAGIKLDDKSIVNYPMDRISSELADPVEDQMRLKIQRVTVKKEKVKQEIAYESQTRSNAKLDKGKSNILSVGQKGEKEIVYEVTYVDGKEEGREEISTKITKEPVMELVEIGTRVKESPKQDKTSKDNGKKIVSVQNYDDCDGSGHGVRVITYEDGTQKQEEY